MVAILLTRRKALKGFGDDTIQGRDNRSRLLPVDPEARLVPGSRSPTRFFHLVASDGVYSYYSTPDNQPYPDLTCIRITLLALTLPAKASLILMARYDIEYQWGWPQTPARPCRSAGACRPIRHAANFFLPDAVTIGDGSGGGPTDVISRMASRKAQRWSTCVANVHAVAQTRGSARRFRTAC